MAHFVFTICVFSISVSGLIQKKNSSLVDSFRGGEATLPMLDIGAPRSIPLPLVGEGGSEGDDPHPNPPPQAGREHGPTVSSTGRNGGSTGSWAETTTSSYLPRE